MLGEGSGGAFLLGTLSSGRDLPLGPIGGGALGLGERIGSGAVRGGADGAVGAERAALGASSLEAFGEDGTMRPGASSLPCTPPTLSTSAGGALRSSVNVESGPVELGAEGVAPGLGSRGVAGAASGAVPSRSVESALVDCPMAAVPETGERPSTKITRAAAAHTRTAAMRCGL